MEKKTDYNQRRIFASQEQLTGIQELRAQFQASTPVELSLQTVGRLVLEAGLKALRQQQTVTA
ncbi:TPA: hypothetical protein JG871_003956 [Enterobacter hormaechei subsp. xiangfangensis]|nr:hypothetical protein [Enterobacter hormaechei subsp. xiangfangensis]